MTPSVVGHRTPLFRIGLSFWIKTLSLGLSSECHWCLWRRFPVTDSGTDSCSQRDSQVFTEVHSQAKNLLSHDNWYYLSLYGKSEKRTLATCSIKFELKSSSRNLSISVATSRHDIAELYQKRCDYNFLDIDKTVLLKILLSPLRVKAIGNKSGHFLYRDCLFELMVIDNWSSQWRH